MSTRGRPPGRPPSGRAPSKGSGNSGGNTRHPLTVTTYHVVLSAFRRLGRDYNAVSNATGISVSFAHRLYTGQAMPAYTPTWFVPICKVMSGEAPPPPEMMVIDPDTDNIREATRVALSQVEPDAMLALMDCPEVADARIKIHNMTIATLRRTMNDWAAALKRNGPSIHKFVDWIGESMDGIAEEGPTKDLSELRTGVEVLASLAKAQTNIAATATTLVEIERKFNPNDAQTSKPIFATTRDAEKFADDQVKKWSHVLSRHQGKTKAANAGG